MRDRLIELAIEALESKKAVIDAEIAPLRNELRPARRGRRFRAIGKAGKRPHISVAGRKTLSKRMKARWVESRAERAKKAAKAWKPVGEARSEPKAGARPGKVKTLLNLTIKREVGPSCPEIKTRLEAWNSGIYWYPGSGFDLMPLAVDTPGTCLDSRIFPVDESGPLLLLSDCSREFIGAISGKMRVEEVYPYQDKYEQLGQKLFIDRTGGVVAEVTLRDKNSPAAVFFKAMSSC